MHGSYISIDWRQACEGASLILPPMEAMAHLVRWFWMIDLLEMTIFQVVKCGNCFSHFRGSMSILPYIAKSWPFQLFWTHCYDWSCHVMSCHVGIYGKFSRNTCEVSKTSLVDWWITAWCMLIPTWVSGGIPIWKRWRIISALYLSDWWLSHPSEKYENQSGWLFPIYMEK